jgi:hypothetical protein
MSTTPSIPTQTGKRKRPPSPDRTKPNPVNELLLHTDRNRYGLFPAEGFSSPPNAPGETALKWPKIAIGPAGYNHSAFKNTFVMNVTLPTWLNDRIILKCNTDK